MSWCSGRRHPVAVESWWHPVRYGDHGLGFAAEILRVDDHQGRTQPGHVDHITHQPAFVFGRALVSRNKNELTWVAVFAELMHQARAGLHVVSDKMCLGAEGGAFVGQRHAVGVTVGLTQPAFVTAGKLLRPVVDDLALDAPRHRIDTGSVAAWI